MNYKNTALALTLTFLTMYRANACAVPETELKIGESLIDLTGNKYYQGEAQLYPFHTVINKIVTENGDIALDPPQAALGFEVRIRRNLNNWEKGKGTAEVRKEAFYAFYDTKGTAWICNVDETKTTQCWKEKDSLPIFLNQEIDQGQFQINITHPEQGEFQPKQRRIQMEIVRNRKSTTSNVDSSKAIRFVTGKKEMSGRGSNDEQQADISLYDYSQKKSLGNYRFSGGTIGAKSTDGPAYIGAVPLTDGKWEQGSCTEAPKKVDSELIQSSQIETYSPKARGGFQAN